MQELSCLNITNNIFDLNDYEKDIIKYTIEYQISVEKAMLDYICETSIILNNDAHILIESDNDRDDNKKTISLGNSLKNAISKIFDAINRLITGLISSLQTLFSPKKNLTTDDYMNSYTGQIRLEKDVQKTNAEIDAQIREGCGLLQKIKSATKGVIPDECIDEWTKGAVDKIERYGPAVIQAKASKMISNVLLNSLEKNKKDVENAKRFGFELSDKNDESSKKSNEQTMKVVNFLNVLIGRKNNIIQTFIKDVNLCNRKIKNKKDNNSEEE